MILVLLGFEFLLPKNAKINRSVYRLIIYFQVAVLGMLVTFPFMGYAAPSILFSTLHLVLSVVFVKLFFRNADQKNPATKFMRVGLIFMLIPAFSVQWMVYACRIRFADLFDGSFWAEPVG
jgi:uncharacterized membrane protein